MNIAVIDTSWMLLVGTFFILSIIASNRWTPIKIVSLRRLARWDISIIHSTTTFRIYSFIPELFKLSRRRNGSGDSGLAPITGIDELWFENVIFELEGLRLNIGLVGMIFLMSLRIFWLLLDMLRERGLSLANGVTVRLNMLVKIWIKYKTRSKSNEFVLFNDFL